MMNFIKKAKRKAKFIVTEDKKIHSNECTSTSYKFSISFNSKRI